MQRNKKLHRVLSALLTCVLTLGLCPTALAHDLTEGARTIGFENMSAALNMTQIGRYDSGMTNADGGVMEIVDYNNQTGWAYSVNGQAGVLTAIPLNTDESQLTSGAAVNLLNGKDIDVKALVVDDGFQYGDMTSVAVSPDGTSLVAAIQAEDYTANGRVALFTCNADGTLNFVRTIETGVQPDMVTFTPDGSKILTANEGEPRQGYSSQEAVDPAGTVTIIETNGYTAQTVGFENFDHDTLAAAGVVLKKDTTPDVDLEPEYIACTNDAAYVACQEANAIAVLDLNSSIFTGVYSVGFQDHSKVAIDLGNGDDTYAPQVYENLKGIRMPDGISLATIGGADYLLIANEGDSRAWPVETEEDVNEIKDKTSPNGKKFEKKVTWFDASQYDGLESGVDYLFGSRSFTLLKVTDTGLEEVFDSGSDFEAKSAVYLPDYFNCSNDSLELEDRSGKKGPEPESVTVGEVNGKRYAFVTLERIGGVMVYDITNPAKVSYVNYINSRDFSADVASDDSPEGLKFISAQNSPTGKALLLAACEVGGTVAVYELAESPFVDVNEDAYYYDAVLWAAENGITGGTSATAFSPEVACTRAQTVTFLWRAAGSPEPKSTVMSFTDVTTDAYYYDAVLWAVENDITSGTSATTFSPNATCTTGQVLTFLWASNGKPAAATSDTAWYATAVAWANNAGLLGNMGVFSPVNPSPRAEIITYLYRNYLTATN